MSLLIAISVLMTLKMNDQNNFYYVAYTDYRYSRSHCEMHTITYIKIIIIIIITNQQFPEII